MKEVGLNWDKKGRWDETNIKKTPFPREGHGLGTVSIGRGGPDREEGDTREQAREAWPGTGLWERSPLSLGYISFSPFPSPPGLAISLPPSG